MNNDIKAYSLVKDLCNKNLKFKEFLESNISSGRIRFFGDEEWCKIRSQNFVSPNDEMKDFEDLFLLGYNIGNCVGTSRQLSYSYSNADIVSGVFPLLKGTLNAEKEGGHCWLETPQSIIDTTLMIVLDKSLKCELGYIEEQRVTSYQLSSSSNYQARKEFVNDLSIRNRRQL
ncbi:MAG: hypothetical protein RR984_02700 [Bacilli bacterium]